eukprot:TRINITY_DN13544_c0_g1_i1.p2 TRINITY_DN13544_c0_g1~~TRINITY_DN13544_c0_g1_i1.p2  ORF type:complete len:122 (+),score=23.31 TRINITY_DN13544_c0_g1_i1:179-544(+)
MKGKRIKVSYNGEMKVVLIKDENYDYLLNSVRTSFNLLSDTEQYEFRWIDSTKEYITASSRDDILNAFDSKVSKFELVLCACLLYTSDAADDTPCVDLGGRRIIKKKKQTVLTNEPKTSKT